MATEIYLKRGGGRSILAAADKASQEYIANLPTDMTLKAVITIPRNYEHLSKFFALLDVVYEQQEVYATRISFRAAITVALGHGETVMLPDGRTIIIPKSISFAKMDQTEFNEFYDGAVRLILEKIIPGVNREELEREVLEILEGRG